ncbi:hypothetical protein D3C71_360790 [compost metagenome]
MRIRAFRPQKEPGVRLSLADIGMVAAAGGASLMLSRDPNLREIAPMPIHLIATFLCFCNLFRIGTAAEVAWGAVFVLSWGAVAAMGLPPYPAVLATTVPALAAAVVWSAMWGRYNGIGHRAVAAMRSRRGETPPLIDLDRFVEAQSEAYPQAREQLAAGRKAGHWMWFIFPNWKGLGKSIYAQKYAIGSVAEAQAYLDHPLLGARLRKCADILLGRRGATAHEIFGTPDDLKLRSCMTLFAALSPAGSPFHEVIDRYFEGVHDERTLEGMRSGMPA